MAERFGNHAPDWQPTAADVPADAPGMAEVVEFAKVESLKPSQADMREAFGDPMVETQGADGGMALVREDSPEGQSSTKVRWSVDMRDAKNRGLLRELTTPHRRASIERGKQWNGRRKVELRHPETGERRLVFEEMEETVGRKTGMTRRWAKGLHVAAGPDGMLFRLVSGTWEATGRTCLGTPLNGDGIATGVQRDPDGGTWLCIEGTWEPVADFYERMTG